MKEIGIRCRRQRPARAPGAQTLTSVRKPDDRKPETERVATPGSILAIRYTPTGNGLVWVSALRDKPEKRPCNKDINPVYQ